MKHLHTFEEFLNESFHEPDGTPIGVDRYHRPVSEAKEGKLQKGDTILYAYNKSGQHPLGGKSLVVALKVKDVTRSGRFVEVFLDGRFKELPIESVMKTSGDFTDGQEITSKADYDFSKGELEFLKNKI